jgi:CheY-like chemotaxis protein
VPRAFDVAFADAHAPAVAAIAERRHVLLVDDDAEIRGVVRLILETEGYEVLTAADGEEALRVLRSGARPGLILLDLRMPGMDGRGFRQVQCADPRLADIPVVIFSGDRDAGPVAASLGTEWLLKPIDLERLLGVVERHCAPRREGGLDPGLAARAPPGRRRP